VDVKSHKHLVHRLVEEGVNQRDADVLDEVAESAFAKRARRWVAPFRGAFPDFEMEIVNLVEEEDVIVADFRCSGTHLGDWLGKLRPGDDSSRSTRSTYSECGTEGLPRRSASRTA
jgi:hypothetical protein